MAVQGLTPILNVSDIEASFKWFESLGWHRRAIWTEDEGEAGFAAVCTDKAEIFLCRDGQGSRGGPSPRHPGDDDTGGMWMSWWVETPGKVDELHELALGLGLEISWPPTDEPWGVREFHLRHPDGHTFRVSSGLAESDR